MPAMLYGPVLFIHQRFRPVDQAVLQRMMCIAFSLHSPDCSMTCTQLHLFLPSSQRTIESPEASSGNFRNLRWLRLTWYWLHCTTSARYRLIPRQRLTARLYPRRLVRSTLGDDAIDRSDIKNFRLAQSSIYTLRQRVTP